MRINWGVSEEGPARVKPLRWEEAQGVCGTERPAWLELLGRADDGDEPQNGLQPDRAGLQGRGKGGSLS